MIRNIFGPASSALDGHGRFSGRPISWALDMEAGSYIG
jgi:hypothetical protein